MSQTAAGPLDVLARPARELPNVVLALADDRRDLVVAVLEYVAKQQYCTLLGRQPLKHEEHGHRERVGHLGVPGRVVLGVGQDRLGEPVARVALAALAR